MSIHPYMKNINEGAEAQLKECFDQCAENGVPHDAFENSLGKPLTALALENELQEESNESDQSHDDPDCDKDPRVIQQLNGLIA